MLSVQRGPRAMHALSLSQNQRRAYFLEKKKKNPPVLKHICLLFVFLMNHVFMQIHIFLLLFSGRLDPCHHLRGGDTYSRFHVSGCCVEWNGAHAYRARVRCELADQTRICL